MLQFSSTHCKFPTEETTGAQNCKIVPKFTQNWGSLASIFAFLDKNMPTERFLTISRQPKFREGNCLCPWSRRYAPCPLDLCHSVGLRPPFSAPQASTWPAASIHSMRWRCSVAISYKDADDASPW